MKKMLFLVNPNAGHSGIRAALLDVTGAFCREYEVTCFVSSAPRQICEKIAAEGEGYDMVVVSGGDGTLSEAVDGLLRLERRPLLGYIPAGSTNDVAYSLRIPTDPVKAADIILHGEEFTLDSGTLNGRAFTYVAAFGAFTAVTYKTPQSEKKALGYLAYVLEGAKSLGEIKPIHLRVTADGAEYEGSFIVGMMCNTLSVGGMRPNVRDKYGVALNDGYHEALFVRAPANAEDWATLLVAAAGSRLDDPKHFLALKAKEMTVSFDAPEAWTVDGEDGGEWEQVSLRNIPAAVRIMVPGEMQTI